MATPNVMQPVQSDAMPLIPSPPYTNVRDPYRPLTEAEKHIIIPPTQGWTDQYALSIVRDSCESMEQFIQQSGHYRRWTEADEQYVAWRPQRMWGTSRKPKARIPVFLLFSQLQSLLPNVMSALFPLHENVDIAPRPGSTLEQARAAWELIMAQLESLGESGITRFRTIALEAFTQAFLYGNGIIELSWLFKVMRRLAFKVSWEPARQWVRDPITGRPMVAPVGPPQRQVREYTQEYVLNQPDVKCIDVRDFLIDPQCPSPDIQQARFCGVRNMPTIRELQSYAGQPGFMVPSGPQLVEMAKQKRVTQADQAKRQSASVWSRDWRIGDDYSTNPEDQRLEMIRWHSNDRCVWMLNREWVFYNRANIYGFKPYLDAFYVPFPNRFHGIALSDVTEGDQHMIASLLEKRLDELSLSIDSPWIRSQGTMIGNPSRLEFSPDKVYDVSGKPDEALMRIEVQGHTQNAMVETNDTYARSARATGLSDTVVMGVPQAGGDSAQRTARGIEAKAEASGKRLQFLIENSESSFIEPLCAILHQFNVRFLPRNQMIPILGASGQQLVIDPVQVLLAQPRFTMRASSRMRSRNALVQILPWFVQTILNPEFLSMLGEQQQQTLNMKVLIDFIMDTLNTPKLELFMPMSPQQVQALNQPDPKSMLDMQKQRERLIAMAEMQQDQGDKELLLQIVKTFGTPRAAESVMGFEDVAHMQAQAAVKKASQRPPARSNGGSR